MPDFKSYYDYLKESINKYRGKFDPVIFYIPEFFRLLTEILNEDIKNEDRVRIYAVLGYFVDPNDLIPEALYGPAGYLDDMFLCTVMLKEIKDKYGDDLLKKHWYEDEDVFEVINAAYNTSNKEMENQGLTGKILTRVGFN